MLYVARITECEAGLDKHGDACVSILRSGEESKSGLFEESGEGWFGERVRGLSVERW